MATPNHSSSSSHSHSQSQPLNPFAQQLHPMLESHLNLQLSAHNSSSFPSPGVPFFIPGDASTTPQQDTTSHERKTPTFDLNSTPSEFHDIPQRISLSNLKQSLRTKKAECHQKTMNFVASCKGGREGKPCKKAYCVHCLWNRYEEKAEVANQLNDWRCPFCRRICNCSRCMKKRGLQPVGIRGRASKRGGFRSVMDRLLAFNGAENINEAVNCRKASTTEGSVLGSDRRTDDGSSSSKKVHLSSELNPTVGMGKEKSERPGGGVKKNKKYRMLSR